MAVTAKKCSYGNWPNALELSNGEVRLVVTLDVGPRVIFYGFTGGENVFVNFPTVGTNAGDEWTSYGGHRLWCAPEAFPRTYYPDNEAVPYRFDGGVLTLDCPAEKGNDLKKTIIIRLAERGTKVELEQKITNVGEWGKNFACWSLSVMAPGGEVIIPQEKYIPHGIGEGETVIPARNLTLWPFTDMSDKRFSWGKDFIRMREDANCGKLKFGVSNTLGVACYRNGETLFVKRSDFDRNAVYTDLNCNQEFYTEPGMLEVEFLSPVRMVEPGESNVLSESWELYKGDFGGNDAELKEKLMKAGVLA